MDNLTDWIGIGLVCLSTLGTMAAVLWRFARVVDRNSIALGTINETIKAQWARIDEHGIALDEHGNRLVRVETRLDYHEKGGA